MTEEWRDIKGFEGYYQVSNHGKVKNVQTNKILKPYVINHKGYLAVDLWKDGQKHRVRIHRLVAETFIPNPENKAQVNHINGNKQDNRVENLEWATNGENMYHAYRASLAKAQYVPVKLTHDDVIKIRREYQEGNVSQKELAKKFGVAESTIWAIVHRKKWKTVS